MFTDLYNKAAELVSLGIPYAVATVVRVEGSSSARRGSKAIIDPFGKLLLGWVGGGCAESAVKSEALKSIETGKPRMITVDMTDEQLGVGMPCGGIMDIFVEPVLPKPELLLIGHGRITETLATLGHLMGFSVTVNDPAAERDSFPQADRLVTEDFDLTETPVGPNSFVVIATQHKRDHLWLRKALQGNAAYIALIASHHRAVLVVDFLRAEGLSEDKVGRVRSPAGLDLGASTPEEIALSVMSQIIALKRGGQGRSLHPREANLLERAGADAVIRQCEADVTRVPRKRGLL